MMFTELQCKSLLGLDLGYDPKDLWTEDLSPQLLMLLAVGTELEEVGH